MSIVRIKIDRVQVQRYFKSPDGPVIRMLETVARRVVNEAKRRVPVAEGILRASIHSELNLTGANPSALIGSTLNYAIFVEKGTGIYAGRGVIRPKRAKALRFKIRGGPVVFAKYVRGQRAQPYLVPALRDVIRSI